MWWVKAGWCWWRKETFLIMKEWRAKTTSSYHLITFFFRVLRLFFGSSTFIGRIGADMIRLLAWNCALRALTDNRPLVADETSELLAFLAGAFEEIAEVLLNWKKENPWDRKRLAKLAIYNAARRHRSESLTVHFKTSRTCQEGVKEARNLLRAFYK